MPVTRNTSSHKKVNNQDFYSTLSQLQRIILDTLEFDEVINKIVNGLLLELEYRELGYEIIVLALIDKKSKNLQRVAISKTKAATKALESTPIPFNKIDIPLSVRKNYCIKAIRNKKPYSTNKWEDILVPPFTKSQAELVQSEVGIKSSIVYPIISKGEVLGTVIFSMSKSESKVSMEERELIENFVDLVSIALQNSILYSQLEIQTLKLREANKDLKELDKQKDEFISIASHELKTPISIAKNNLWMFKYASKNKFTKRQEHFISEMENGLSRLQKIVNDLLDISRMQQGRLELDLEKRSIYEVILEAIDNFEDLARQKGLEIIAPKENKDTITIDPERFVEVIENLLSNAIKYTETGSITVNLVKKPDKYKISITDTGPGIPKRDQSKIFKKFGRATQGLKMSTPGASTGLGLYITKSYVEAMGGRIGFNSKVGKGTEFWFTIPTTPPKKTTDK